MTNGTEFAPVEMVIFGAAGDLTWRKLIPALYNLYLDKLIPEKFAIFGVDAKPVGINRAAQAPVGWGEPILQAWKSQA